MRREHIKTGTLIVAILLSLSIPFVSAGIFTQEDITFSLNQTDYYFTTGENAVIPIQIENTYGKQINGQLTNTYTQEINQGGMSMSSSRSQSITFSVEDGESTQGLSFGTADTPTTLNIALMFKYTEKEERIVNMNDIRIHFVSDESQKQNQENQQSSSSEAQSSSQQNTQQQTQSPEQALENNQMTQDSNALQQQIQKQNQEQEEMKNAFQKELAQNQNFQEEHQELLQEGYNLTNANLNPTSNNTGNFELNYEKPTGEEASLKGEMKDGEMQSLEKDTTESRQEARNKLEQNKQFQKYQEELQKEGYTEQNTAFSQEQNKTNIEINYMNENNETASISADIINDSVKHVELTQETQDKNKKNIFLIIFIVLVASIIGYLIYKKFNKKQKIVEEVVKKKVEKAFNYKSESLKMIAEAKKKFDKKEYKDAYGNAGQALRLYLSYDNKLNKEITNDEILAHLRKEKKEYKEVKECFDLCSLVEFAKYEANKKDFNKIITSAEKHING